MEWSPVVSSEKGFIRFQNRKEVLTYLSKRAVSPQLDTRIYYVDHKYIIDQLPAAHSSTGCDTIGKVWTKLSLISKRLETDEEFLTYFGKQRLDSDMIADAEKFLVKVVSKKYESCDSFGDLRVKLYHHSKGKRFIDLVCGSDEIQQNIMRAYSTNTTLCRCSIS